MCLWLSSVIIGWSTRNDSITSSPVTEKGNFASWVYKAMQEASCLLTQSNVWLFLVPSSSPLNGTTTVKIKKKDKKKTRDNHHLISFLVVSPASNLLCVSPAPVAEHIVLLLWLHLEMIVSGKQAVEEDGCESRWWIHSILNQNCLQSLSPKEHNHESLTLVITSLTHLQTKFLAVDCHHNHDLAYEIPVCNKETKRC